MLLRDNYVTVNTVSDDERPSHEAITQVRLASHQARQDVQAGAEDAWVLVWLYLLCWQLTACACVSVSTRACPLGQETWVYAHTREQGCGAQSSGTALLVLLW